MKKRTKLLALILSLAFILALFAGCGGNASSDDSAATDNSAAATEAPQTSGDDQQPDDTPNEEPAVYTGEVIPADQCDADVLYGMYDYETPVTLPLTEDGETLSYWFFTQPFMGPFDADYETLTFFKEMEERTGVTLELQTASLFVAAEQFNIMVTSGDYPDLIETAGSFYNGGAAAAIEDDVIIDLNSVVDQYMPNYLAYLNLDETGGARKAVTTVNGQLHMIGYYIEQFYNAGTIIRQDWLDEVGLDAPVTYDDMHDVLEAFSVAGHSNALWISYNGYTRNNAFSGGANVVFDSDQDPLIVNNGVVEYSPITEDTHSFITMLNQWWNEGLIYSDFITQDPSLDYPEDSVATTKAGIMVDDCDKMLYFEGLADDIDLAAIANPRINAGDTAHVGLKHQYTQGGISVSTQCENVELAAKWLDYLFTYDGYVLGNFGVEGEGLQFDENGEPEYTDLVMNNPDMTTIACTVIYSKYGGAGVCNGTRELRNYTDEQWAAIDTWSANVDSANMYPYEDIMTYDENTEYANLLNEIAIYVDENLSKFIVGDRSLDEWDSYVNTLKGMGVDDMTAIAQTAYDRYLAQ